MTTQSVNITEKEENMERYNPVAAGIVIHVSLKHLEPVKTAIINVINKIGTQAYADDRIYVYHPELTRIPVTRGEQVAATFYFVPPNNFDVELALKQTTYIVGYEEQDMRKHVVLITDQYSSKKQNKYKKALYIDRKERFDCAFHFLGLGKQDFQTFEEFPDTEFLDTDVTELEGILLERFKYETSIRERTENSPSSDCCQVSDAGEDCQFNTRATQFGWDEAN